MKRLSEETSTQKLYWDDVSNIVLGGTECHAANFEECRGEHRCARTDEKRN